MQRRESRGMLEGAVLGVQPHCVGGQHWGLLAGQSSPREALGVLGVERESPRVPLEMLGLG